VVGIPNHGLLRIDDTLSEGEEIVFRGVPSFAPEILRRVKLADAMKGPRIKPFLALFPPPSRLMHRKAARAESESKHAFV
jgi:hypothetical protein